MFTFRLLGPFAVAGPQGDCTPTAPKAAALLALLVANTNRVVSADTIVDELWGERPPKSATTTTQTYVYQVRTALGRAASTVPRGDLIGTESPGYVLRADPEHIDSHRFERITAEAEKHLHLGRAEDAAEQLRTALALWQGPALGNLPQGRLLEGHARRLEEARMRALELRILADFACGQHRALIPELRYLVAEHPYNEWLHARLMDALFRSGRRHDALQAYGNARTIMVEHLGLEPSAELQQLQLDVLSA